MRFFTSFFIVCVSVLPLQAQNETANWIISSYVNNQTQEHHFLNFSDGELSVNQTETHNLLDWWFIDSQTSSISDSSGNLLFYTLDHIMNKEHEIMPGQSIAPHQRIAKSMIIPVPEAKNLFYVFYLYHYDYGGARSSLAYYLVDMSLENGKGQVIESHELFSGIYSPSFTIIKHANRKDFWFIYRDMQEHCFKARRITEEGLEESSVISVPEVELPDFGSSNAVPYLYFKSSPDGSKLVIGIGNLSHFSYKLYLLDFNTETGSLANSILLTDYNGYLIFDFEFSPDSRKLYCSYFQDIIQLTIAGTTQEIIQSAKSVKTCQDSYTLRLLLGQDGKIYTGEALVDESNSTLSFRMGVIHDPNSEGVSCFWEADNGLFNQSIYLLFPVFVADFVRPVFQYSQTCLGDETLFNLTDLNAIRADWNFDDEGSVDNTVLDNLNPAHTFTVAGDHYVKCTLHYADGSKKTYGSNVRIKEPVQPFSLGQDTILCEGEVLRLQPCLPGVSFVWQDGSENSYLEITSNDTIVLKISNECNSKVDSLIVRFQEKHSVDIGRDTALCFDQLPVLIEAPSLTDATYLWSSGSEERQVALTQNGYNYVDVSIGACTVRDSIYLDISPSYPQLELGNDTTLCEGDTLLLNVSNEGAEYLWQDGTTDSAYAVTTTQLVVVSVRSGSCVSADQVQVEFTSKPEVSLGADTSICNGDTLYFNVFTEGAFYSWQDETNTPEYYLYKEGLYYVQVRKEACMETDSIRINIIDNPYIITQNDFLICEGDSLELRFDQEEVLFLWNNESPESYFVTDQPGTVTLIRENKCGIRKDTFKVSLEVIPFVEISGTMESCVGDTIILYVNSNTDFEWDNGSPDNMLLVTSSGNYIVKAENGCGLSEKEHNVDFQICCSEDIFPNLITPNGDKLNDVFYFDCAQQGGWMLTIFNRYGELVFRDKNYMNTWDAKGFSEGVYFYSLSKDNTVFNGWVHIVR